MRHLKKFFESTELSDKEFILENFISISDKFGEPEIYSNKFGDKKKWTVIWNMKLNISVLQEANQLVSKLKEIVEDIDDVLSASYRLEDYNIYMSLGQSPRPESLKVELVPKDTGGGEFKFIKKYESRELLVRINEVERFFNSRGVRVINWDVDNSYNEYNETNDLEINLSNLDVETIDDFKRMVNQELRLIDDRDYTCHSSGKTVYISPSEEKSYVSVTNS